MMLLLQLLLLLLLLLALLSVIKHAQFLQAQCAGSECTASLLTVAIRRGHLIAVQPCTHAQLRCKRGTYVVTQQVHPH
jgi:hypothetical protein